MDMKWFQNYIKNPYVWGENEGFLIKNVFSTSPNGTGFPIQPHFSHIRPEKAPHNIKTTTCTSYLVDDKFLHSFLQPWKRESSVIITL